MVTRLSIPDALLLIQRGLTLPALTCLSIDICLFCPLGAITANLHILFLVTVPVEVVPAAIDLGILKQVILAYAVIAERAGSDAVTLAPLTLCTVLLPIMLGVQAHVSSLQVREVSS
jgi:hypothetical protein